MLRMSPTSPWFLVVALAAVLLTGAVELQKVLEIQAPQVGAAAVVP